MVDDGERFFFQPCFSPVWDTAIAAYALAQSDPHHPAVRRAADWLLARRGPAQGRLVREAAPHRAFRLGLRIPQRVLSGYRRHRHGDAGAEPGAGLRCRGAEGLPPAGARLAAGHAIARWRMGGFRRRQQLEVPEQRSLRRSQRHARSHLPGYHRARPGGAGGARRGPRSPRGAARRRVAHQEPAGRWKLVRPLGRGVHLRHLLRAARPGGGGGERPRSPRPARRRVAAFHPERRRRLGRKLRQLR